MKNTYIMEHEKKLMIAGAVLVSIILIFIVRSCQNRQELRNELEIENLSTFIRWFGTDAFCDRNWEDLDNVEAIANEIGVDPIILLSSPCTIDTRSHALTWQESGLLGLGILNQEQVVNILNSQYFRERSAEVQADIESLLTGGFPILDEPGFNSEQFLTAISHINWILRDLEIDIHIRTAWHELVQRN